MGWLAEKKTVFFFMNNFSSNLSWELRLAACKHKLIRFCVYEELWLTMPRPWHKHDGSLQPERARYWSLWSESINVFVFRLLTPRFAELDGEHHVVFHWKVIWASGWCQNRPHCLSITAHYILTPLQLSAPWQRLALLSGCSEDSAWERAVFQTHPMSCSLC